MKQVLGIDLGGTTIKLGRFWSDGSCVRSKSVATPQPAIPAAVLDLIVTAIEELDPDRESCAIGIGMPGPTDAAGRIARIAINLPDWIDVPLADWLEAKTGRPTIAANDANCAGLGEAWLGAGRSFRNFILLTLGTGVGGAIILNRELFIGHNGAAGELGLVSLDAEGAPCNSGNRGSLEQHASIQAIRRRTGKAPEELGRLARSHDPEALEFWRSYGHDLGVGLTSLIYVLSPEAIVIGGGVSASAEFFLPSAIAQIQQRVMPTSREGLQIIPAELGNRAGMVGAAKLAIDRMELG